MKQLVGMSAMKLNEINQKFQVRNQRHYVTT